MLYEWICKEAAIHSEISMSVIRFLYDYQRVQICAHSHVVYLVGIAKFTLKKELNLKKHNI